MSVRYQAEPPERVGQLWVIGLSETQRGSGGGWAWFEKAPSAVIVVSPDNVRCLSVNGQTLKLAWAYERFEGLRETVEALKA